MSDIGLNFSGVLAVFVLIAASLVSILAAIILLVASIYKTRANGQRFAEQNMFAYFLAATGLLAFNGLAFVFLTAVIDGFSRDAREAFDILMLLGWLPLNLAIFFVAGRALRRKFSDEK